MSNPSTGTMVTWLLLAGATSTAIVGLCLGIGFTGFGGSSRSRTRIGGWLGRITSLTLIALGVGGGLLTALGLVAGGRAIYDQWSTDRAQVVAVRKECTELRLPEWLGWIRDRSTADPWAPNGSTPMQNQNTSPAAQKEFIDRCVATNIEDD